MKCLLSFFVFYLAGFYAAGQLDRRVKQLKSLEKTFSHLKREIEYRQSSLPEAFLEAAGKGDKPWNMFFREAGTALSGKQEQGPEEMVKEAVNKCRKYHPWEKDLGIIKGLGKYLGGTDKKMQIIQLNVLQEELLDNIREAGQEQKQKGRLYRSLGICMGLLSVIILI